MSQVLDSVLHTDDSILQATLVLPLVLLKLMRECLERNQRIEVDLRATVLHRFSHSVGEPLGKYRVVGVVIGVHVGFVELCCVVYHQDYVYNLIFLERRIRHIR